MLLKKHDNIDPEKTEVRIKIFIVAKWLVFLVIILSIIFRGYILTEFNGSVYFSLMFLLVVILLGIDVDIRRSISILKLSKEINSLKRILEKLQNK